VENAGPGYGQRGPGVRGTGYGVPGYGVPGYGVPGYGVRGLVENTGSGGKRGVWWKTRGTIFFAKI